jgi:hypothetical protein
MDNNVLNLSLSYFAYIMTLAGLYLSNFYI